MGETYPDAPEVPTESTRIGARIIAEACLSVTAFVEGIAKAGKKRPKAQPPGSRRRRR